MKAQHELHKPHTSPRPEKQQTRLDALQRQIERLQRRIRLLDSQSNRYGWTRVAIFFAGLLLSVALYFLAAWWSALISALFTITAFSIVAYFQRRIERGITRRRIWIHIMSTQIARIRLDWAAIPLIHTRGTQEDHPFEIDLDITGKHSLHRLVNTAISQEGSLRLRDWFLNTTPDHETILRRQALVRELTSLTGFRNRLTLKSVLAASNVANQLEGQRLLNWLNTHKTPPLLLQLLFISLGFSLLTIVLFVLNLLAYIPQYWTIVLVVFIIFLFVTRDRRGDLFQDANDLRDSLAQLSTVFTYLETYRYGKNRQLKMLCAPYFADRDALPSVLLTRIQRVAEAASLQKNMLLWLILNLLVPWDFYLALRFHRYKDQVASRLPVWLDTWFELEALCSLANFAYLNPHYVVPAVFAPADKEAAALSDITAPLSFSARGLGHPLLPAEQKVTNDFAMRNVGEIDIVTGSNMSGKSTFLRTLGINLCLAYAGAPVNATAFSTTLFRLFTCIKISDSVTEGYSYFYAEVRRLRALLTALERDNQDLPLFFLIDEIFKGTNNRERRIGSEAYIQTLATKRCLGLVSTHDLELVNLANLLSQVQNYHFREEVVDGQMVFDYVLRTGPCPTTNALKIMEMEGLPIKALTDNTE